MPETEASTASQAGFLSPAVSADSCGLLGVGRMLGGGLERVAKEVWTPWDSEVTDLEGAGWTLGGAGGDLPREDDLAPATAGGDLAVGLAAGGGGDGDLTARGAVDGVARGTVA